MIVFCYERKHTSHFIDYYLITEPENPLRPFPLSQSAYLCIVSTMKYIQLEEELSPFKKTMARASDTILDQEVSKYPIFVVHQHELEIGVLLVSASEASAWSIHASTLEEFVSKQIVEMEKVDDFREVFKDPKEYFCLFVLSELGANFIFLPAKDDIQF